MNFVILILLIGTAVGIAVRLFGGGYLSILLIGGLACFLATLFAAKAMHATGINISLGTVILWFLISGGIRLVIKKF